MKIRAIRMKILLSQFLFLLLMIMSVVFSVNGGLKWVTVNVPQYRIPGEMAQLQCDYNLGNNSLYAVKWYRDHEEFYKFVPRARPEASSYNVEGIHVDLNLSDSRKVVLHSVNLKTSGLFRCEVSAEAPAFVSAQSEARMEVVSLPKEDPIITGMQENPYQLGDEINLNCTSGKSYPASTLHWYINKQQVTNKEVLIEYPLTQHYHGLLSSTLGLRFVLTAHHFLGGLMRVKCVAFVSPVLWRGNRESVVQSLPMKEMREALLFVTNSAKKQVLYSTSLMFLTGMMTTYLT